MTGPRFDAPPPTGPRYDHLPPPGAGVEPTRSAPPEDTVLYLGSSQDEDDLAGTVMGGPPALATWAVPPPPPHRRSDNRLLAVLLGLAIGAAVIGVVVLVALFWPSADDNQRGTASPAPVGPTTAGQLSSSSATAPTTVTNSTIVSSTVTVTSTVPVPTTVRPTPTPTPTPPARAVGDLGLVQPITQVSCDGTPIVIYASATDPATNAAKVQAALDAHPDASYLRTDQACPSLTQSVGGNAVYAVFHDFTSIAAACAEREAVTAAGGSVSTRLLDNGTPTSSTFSCE